MSATEEKTFRTTQTYARMAENALDKVDAANDNGNSTGAYLHLQAAVIFSNLAVAAATVEATKARTSAGKGGYL